MASEADAAVRSYLMVLRDPSSLRDEKRLDELRRALDESSDELERLKLRQQIHDLQSPDIEAYEAAFAEHAREWAQNNGVGEQAFLDEGVPPETLRRAGFRNVAGGRRRGSGARRSRSRVSAQDVRAAIPKGQFTIRQLQERSGASAAVVRRVVQEEQGAGRLAVVGTDRAQSGPGRSATVYKAQ